MNTNDTRPRGRRPNNRNSRDNRRDSRDRDARRTPPEAPKKLSLWQKFLGLFSRKPKKPTAPSRDEQSRTQNRTQGERRRSGPPEKIAVTSPRLYVGNLSYDATESDLSNLFNGVGKVQSAEIVSHRDTERSKGFGFVTMLTVDEAIRAVETLHDQDFMGRRLVVTGSRSDGIREPRV